MQGGDGWYVDDKHMMTRTLLCSHEFDVCARDLEVEELCLRPGLETEELCLRPGLETEEFGLRPRARSGES